MDLQTNAQFIYIGNINSRMNAQEYYLGKLAEECSEVIQNVFKTQHFGPYAIKEGQPLNNYELCHLELDDLNAVIEILNEQFDFKYTPDPKRMQAKKEKMKKWFDLLRQHNAAVSDPLSIALRTLPSTDGAELRLTNNS